MLRKETVPHILCAAVLQLCKRCTPRVMIACTVQCPNTILKTLGITNNEDDETINLGIENYNYNAVSRLKK